ncbi:MAG: amidohydrolase family protein [Mycoplasmataceae bacterium]|nr:amidohydrolase family protein [Mycoplasmataceae bacterium]
MSNKYDKVVKNIDILIHNKKIIEVGKNIKISGTKVINATNKYVLPGLINCHTHIPMNVFKEAVDGYSLQDWLTKVIWPIEDKLTNNDMYWFTKLGVMESLISGVTTINDMYFKTDQIIKVCNELGINWITSPTLIETKDKKKDDDKFNQVRNLVNQYGNKNVSLCIHGLYTCSPNYLTKCVGLAKELNLKLLHIHFCENDNEVKQIKKIHHVKHPSEVLLRYFKDYKIILAHCVKLSNTDFKNLKKLDCTISYNPITNCKLGCGFANVNKMKQSNIVVGLGTDGDGSGCNQSIMNVARFACLLQKGINENPTSSNAYDVLKMATINGAKALKIDETKGSIDINKDADLVLYDLNDIMTNPINDPISDIVYNSSYNNVDTVIVNGKILISNRKPINVDINRLINKCNKLSIKLKLTNG